MGCGVGPVRLKDGWLWLALRRGLCVACELAD